MPPGRSTPNRPRSPFPADGPPLGFLLAAVGFGTGYRFREVIAPTGMQPREFAVLRQVAIDEGISQQACGHALKVAPSQMVALVDALEDKGLIQRRPDPADRRGRGPPPPAQGQEEVVTGVPAAGGQKEARFGPVTPGGRAEPRPPPPGVARHARP